METHELICTEVWGGNGNIATDLLIPGLQGYLYSQSSDGHKGGDVYYATACSGGLVSRMYLADVTGHGEPVVKVSHWLHDILRDTIDYKEPNRVFAALNERVHEYGLDALTTAASITFNAIDRTLAVCYAGHPPILTHTPADEAWRPLDIQVAEPRNGEAQNLPLGVSRGTEYVNGVTKVTDGTRIFVYSDGLTETPGKDGKLFGIDRLVRSLEEGIGIPIAEAVQKVADAVSKHAGTNDLTHDDVTFAMLEVTPRKSAPVVVQVLGNKLRNLLKPRESAPAKA